MLVGTVLVHTVLGLLCRPAMTQCQTQCNTAWCSGPCNVRLFCGVTALGDKHACMQQQLAPHHLTARPEMSPEGSSSWLSTTSDTWTGA